MRSPLLILATLALSQSALASVVVLSNRTGNPIPVRLLAEGGLPQSATLEPGSSRPFFSATPLRAVYSTRQGDRVDPLLADEAYHFVVRPGGAPELRRIGLGSSTDDRVWRSLVKPLADREIGVLLCVDEEEPLREELWKQRLLGRFERAAEVIRAHSGVSLKAIGFARWQSDNRLNDFSESLREFERTVSPPVGAVAIGFSSQYEITRGRRRLGGTRGPFRRHIMLREFSPQISESDRVELLVHEIGHFLGAAHSPEPMSVMRPVLGDRHARRKGYRIGFDPVNTLAIAMVGEEVRQRGVRSFDRLTPERKARLQEVYAVLAKSLPRDPAAKILLSRTGGRLAKSETAVGLEAVVARVVEAISLAAVEAGNGDERANTVIRAAARVASEAPDEYAAKGFLIGIGVGLDKSSTMRSHPRTSVLAVGAETSEDRKLRLRRLGGPTARGRRDTLLHFAVMAALTAATTPEEAELWGLSKEAVDSQGGTGYSFADLAANRAGSRFAQRVLQGTLPLEGLAKHFRVNDFVPPLEGLAEGLPLEEVIEKYGGKNDPRFEAVLDEIDQRIDRLPPYSLLNLGIE